jgi:predicted Holliday junction resolvase-like endonuclease
MNKKVTSITVGFSDGSVESIPKGTLSLINKYSGDHNTINGFLCETLRYFDRQSIVEEQENIFVDKLTTKELEHQQELALKDKRNADNKVLQRGVNIGYLTEKFLPFFPEYKYNPFDIRYVGHTFDFLVLDGLEDSKQISSLIFQEIKTGLRPKILNHNEKALRDFVCTLNHPKIKYEQWIKKDGDNIFSVITNGVK